MITISHLKLTQSHEVTLNKLKSASLICFIQKQPLRGVPRKKSSENIQQIYRRALMQKCDCIDLTNSVQSILQIF